MKKTVMNKDEFFYGFGDRLVKVNDEDDVETGCHQLMCPEERDVAQEYVDKGYAIASLYEHPDGDFIKIDNDLSETDNKYGWFVLHRGCKETEDPDVSTSKGV